MIELHKLKDDEFSEEIEEKMEDMLLAHESVSYDRKEDASFDLPYIKEGKTIVNTPGKIESYLRELESELKLQRSISGDGCYIDPRTGKVC